MSGTLINLIIQVIPRYQSSRRLGQPRAQSEGSRWFPSRAPGRPRDIARGRARPPAICHLLTGAWRRWWHNLL